LKKEEEISGERKRVRRLGMGVSVFPEEDFP
jgi:hypothetical protein